MSAGRAAESLYDTDFVAWSEQQAALLRRHLAGERVNGLDWDNIVEELGDLGKSETQAVASLLTQAMIHALKIARWPESRARDHWTAEGLTFLDQARARYLPSMARTLDAGRCFQRARKVVLATPGDAPARPLPEDLAPALAELMDEEAELGAVLDAIRGGRP